MVEQVLNLGIKVQVFQIDQHRRLLGVTKNGVTTTVHWEGKSDGATLNSVLRRTGRCEGREKVTVACLLRVRHAGEASADVTGAANGYSAVSESNTFLQLRNSEILHLDV